MRYLSKHIAGDLKKKMVFLSGPRQVGKTYLAKHLLDEARSDQYYNWDRAAHRKIITKIEWDKQAPMVVFDELHKYKQWKNWLKGVYDTEPHPPYYLVTGSARLNVFRKGGDSLMGRYFHYRLNPFSVRELVKFNEYGVQKAFKDLWERGGFPEPLFSKGRFDVEKWRKEKSERILHEDLLNIELVRRLNDVEYLIELLKERVGSPISYQSLSEDLSVSPPTVKSWIELLERLYVVFRVMPYSRSLSRTIRKESKVYFYDYSDIQNEGAKFENMVAAHLLKHVQYLEDTMGKRIQLLILRDKEKREIDFVIAENNKPIQLIEVKLSDADASRSLAYYAERFSGAEAIQVVKNLDKNKTSLNINIKKADEFLLNLFA
jgi:predicted AAA+ superfamily ATPase